MEPVLVLLGVGEAPPGDVSPDLAREPSRVHSPAPGVPPPIASRPEATGPLPENDSEQGPRRGERLTILTALGISPRTAFEVEKRPFYVTEDGKGQPVKALFA